MLIQNKYHLSYCSNIHPGEDWEQTYDSLKTYLPKIKKQVSPESPFGIGLRLSNVASLGLDEGSNLKDFKDWLDRNQFYVFTMNGFPYGNFHNERVKDMVHAPDWTTKERLDYTKRLFDQLAFLIPEGLSGGISTSPVSYRHWHSSEEALDMAFATGAKSMADIVLQLIPIATQKLKTVLGCNKETAKDLILRHITVCYDVCHFSLAYEEPEDTLANFSKAGIKVGKIQVSSALKILFKEGDNEAIWNSLSQFNEPTYLHQVTEKVGNKVVTYKDLPEVLEQRSNAKELRSHFHVPIFLEKYDHLFSTQDQILKVLEYLRKNQFSDQLEIETYTWDVLPKDLKTELSNCIVREIEWLKSKI